LFRFGDEDSRSDEDEVNADPNSDDEKSDIIFVSDTAVTIKPTFEIINKVRQIVLKFKSSFV
jgi:hypothetical protein